MGTFCVIEFPIELIEAMRIWTVAWSVEVMGEGWFVSPMSSTFALHFFPNILCEGITIALVNFWRGEETIGLPLLKFSKDNGGRGVGLSLSLSLSQFSSKVLRLVRLWFRAYLLHIFLHDIPYRS